MKSLGARKNSMNTCIVLPGTHRSARRMRLKSGHQLQPIANLPFVCFICQNYTSSKILSSNIIPCNFIYTMLNGIFKLWVILFTSFCREQAKRLHCQFICRAHTFMSLCRAHFGCVHMGWNHVPKDISDRDPKRDWDHDLNYVRSHALQMPTQSRSGSAH